MFWRIALRNLFRNKRRTLLTGLTMWGSYILSSMTMGLVGGTYGFVIDQFTRGSSGHLQILSQGYLDRPSLQNSLPHPNEISSQVQQALGQELQGLAPRLEAGGLLVSGKEVLGVQIIAIDPVQEKQTTRLLQQIQGDSPWNGTNANNGIVLTRDLVERLKLTLGQDLVLMSQGADGSLGNDRFMVIGIMNEGASTVYLNMNKAQEFLSSQEVATRMIITLKDLNHTDEALKKVRLLFPDKDIQPWMVIEEEFYRAMKSDQSAIFLTMGIFLFLAAFGVLNTVLMAILERTREFGIMRVLGTQDKQLIFVIVLEQILLSLTMCLFGALTAGFLNIFLSEHGIPYPAPIEIGGMTLHHLYGSLNWSNMLYPFIVVVCSSAAVSLIPAIRSTRLPLVKALGER